MTMSCSASTINPTLDPLNYGNYGGNRWRVFFGYNNMSPNPSCTKGDNPKPTYSLGLRLSYEFVFHCGSLSSISLWLRCVSTWGTCILLILLIPIVLFLLVLPPLAAAHSSVRESLSSKVPLVWEPQSQLLNLCWQITVINDLPQLTVMLAHTRYSNCWHSLDWYYWYW